MATKPSVCGSSDSAKAAVRISRPGCWLCCLALACLVPLVQGQNIEVSQWENGWFREDPLDSNEIFDFYRTSTDVAYVVGDDSNIYKTSNMGEVGGVAWTKVYTGTPTRFHCFVNDTHGWLVGLYGAIVYTTNGGDTWIKQAIVDSTQNPFYDGVDWKTIAIPPPERNAWGRPLDPLGHAYVVGTEGHILRTENWGSTWVKLESRTSVDLYSVTFMSTDIGAVAGDRGTILYTSDRGSSWDFRNAESETSSNFATTKNIRGIFFPYDSNFVNPDRGWVVGEEGLIMRTEDAGVSWTHLEGCTNSTLLSITVMESFKAGWLTSRDGSICASTDTGINWFMQVHASDNSLNKIHYFGSEWPQTFGTRGEFWRFFLSVPLAERMLGVSVWLWVNSGQPTLDRGQAIYMMDARYGTEDARVPEGYYSNSAVGDIYERIYRDGRAFPVNWETVGTETLDQWVHIHVEFNDPISDDITLMSRVNTGDPRDAEGCLAGSVSEVMLWSHYLSADQVAKVAIGFDQLVPQTASGETYLRALYPMEEGTGDLAYDFTTQLLPMQSFNGPFWAVGVVAIERSS
eukprot:gene5521-6695_t